MIKFLVSIFYPLENFFPSLPSSSTGGPTVSSQKQSGRKKSIFGKMGVGTKGRVGEGGFDLRPIFSLR